MAVKIVDNTFESHLTALVQRQTRSNGIAHQSFDDRKDGFGFPTLSHKAVQSGHIGQVRPQLTVSPTNRVLSASRTDEIGWSGLLAIKAFIGDQHIISASGDQRRVGARPLTPAIQVVGIGTARTQTVKPSQNELGGAAHPLEAFVPIAHGAPAHTPIVSAGLRGRKSGGIHNHHGFVDPQPAQQRMMQASQQRHIQSRKSPLERGMVRDLAQFQQVAYPITGQPPGFQIAPTQIEINAQQDTRHQLRLRINFRTVRVAIQRQHSACHFIGQRCYPQIATFLFVSFHAPSLSHLF